MRIVIAEDAAVLREGLVQLLTVRGHDVVAVDDAQALLAAVDEHAPDVVVVDVRMPPTFVDEGLRAARQLRKDHPDLGILVFSQYVETHFAAELLAERSAGTGYLLKERVADVRDFLDALERIRGGGTVLDPEVVTRLVSRERHRSALSRLTPREGEVLSLMAQGQSNASIATALGVTERAVEKHVSNIFVKLGLPASEGQHRRVMAVLQYLRS